MVKIYKAKSATIEIDERNLVIKFSGFFAPPKKTIQLKDINEVKLGNSSVFSKDVVEIRYKDDTEKVQFTTQADAKQAVTEIADIVKKSKHISSFGGLDGIFTTLLGIGKEIAAESKKERERRREKEIQKAAEECQKAFDNAINSATVTTTTYVNGRILKRLTSNNNVEAIFLAEYVKSPRTIEQPWAQTWSEQYGIKNVQAYLQDVVNDGFLEEAVLGKALSGLTVEQLKTIASELSINPSGTKNTLIQQLVEEVDNEKVRNLLPMPVYALTNEGIAFLRANQSVLADSRIDCEKAIVRGKNIAPEFKESDAKKKAKKRTAKKQLTDAEKLKEYKKSLRLLYEALKGSDIREQIATIKACKPSRNELEDGLRAICADCSYSPIPYTETIGNIRKYKDFYSEELIDQIYKGQTKYMLFNRDGFSDLIKRISDEDSFDFFAHIDKKWNLFVTEYLKTH